MSKAEAQFMAIVTRYTNADPDVYPGKMMHSPGLKYKDKIFAFYYNESMCFRLGPKFNPEKFGLKNVQLLSPFRTKPPLKGWFVIEKHESNLWEALTAMSLEYTKTL